MSPDAHDTSKTEPASGPHGQASVETSSAHARLTRIVSLLIFLQIILLTAISYWMLRGVDWGTKGSTLTFSQPDIDALAASFWFLLSSLLLLIAAIGLMFLRRFAWIMAMSVQILLLTLTLTTYFFGTAPTLERANPIFEVMGFAVVLVFYLNLEGVRSAVHWRREEE